MGKNPFDDILKHYGVEGMKWDVRRTPEQLAAARNEKQSNDNKPQSNGGDKSAESILDKALDNLEDLKEDIKDITDDVKAKGKAMISGLFKRGPSAAEQQADIRKNGHKYIKNKQSGPREETSFSKIIRSEEAKAKAKARR